MKKIPSEKYDNSFVQDWLFVGRIVVYRVQKFGQNLFSREAFERSGVMTLSEKYYFTMATPHLLWIATGGVVAFGSSWMTDWCPSWIWQIIISMALIAMAMAMDSVIAPRVQIKTRVSKLYQAVLWVILLLGFLIFFNFGRYDSVLEVTGDWPLKLVGAILVAGGATLFIIAGRDRDHQPRGQSCSSDDHSIRLAEELRQGLYVRTWAANCSKRARGWGMSQLRAVCF